MHDFYGGVSHVQSRERWMRQRLLEMQVEVAYIKINDMSKNDLAHGGAYHEKNEAQDPLFLFQRLDTVPHWHSNKGIGKNY